MADAVRPYRQQFANLSLDELADRAAGVEPGSHVHNAAMAEFKRREAIATEDTAKYTKRNALYLLLSVIVLTAASVANVIVAIATAR